MHSTLSQQIFLSFLLLLVTFQAGSKVTKSSSKVSKNIAIYYQSNNLLIDELARFKEFSTTLKQELLKTQTNVNIQVYNLSKKHPFEIDELLKLNNDLGITIGEKALFRVLASRSNVPIFSLKTPKITLDRMQNIYADLGIELTGIYREQPLIKQLALAKAIQPNYQNIYLLLGKMSRYHFDDYKKEIKSENYTLNYRLLKNQDSPSVYFDKMMPQKGFLILLDNPQQFSRQKVESLLATSFRLNIPMIGNREVHGNLGALATVYSNDAHLVTETSKILTLYFNGHPIQQPHYLNNFSIYVNQQIANNYNFKSLDEKQLEIKLKSTK